MSKVEAIISVYGKLNKCVFVGDEEICGWKIESVNKKELLEKYTVDEIISIYESGI